MWFACSGNVEGMVVNSVELGVLMSPNPSGMHEDPCCW